MKPSKIIRKHLRQITDPKKFLRHAGLAALAGAMAGTILAILRYAI